MAFTQPPAQPTISGNTLTVDQFLNDTPEVYRQLRTIIQQRFISGRLLRARNTTTSGSVLVDTSEGIFADNDPKPVNPGSRYPRTPIPLGQGSLFATVKWGNGTDITLESVSRRNFDPVRRGMLKLANSHARKIDTVALAAVESAVTQSTGAGTAWASATAAQIFGNIVDAVTSLLALNQGYNPDIVVASDANWGKALVAFADKGYFPREDAANAVSTGSFTTVNGLTWLRTPNMNTPTEVIVADSSALGGFTDEKLGGPGWVSDTQDETEGLEVKTFYVDDNADGADIWTVLARRTTVPWVQEAAAAWKITGVSS